MNFNFFSFFVQNEIILFKISIINIFNSLLRLSRDLKKIIICNGVRNADNATWNKLLSKYNENQDDDDILAGLGCTSNKGLLNSYLKMAINDSYLGGNRDKIFKAVYEGSDLGVDVSLDFLNSNIHDLLLR